MQKIIMHEYSIIQMIQGWKLTLYIKWKMERGRREKTNKTKEGK